MDYSIKNYMKKGFEGEILFDGLGTQWPGEFSKADHPMNTLYKKVMKLGIIKGGCQASYYETILELGAASSHFLLPLSYLRGPQYRGTISKSCCLTPYPYTPSKVCDKLMKN